MNIQANNLSFSYGAKPILKIDTVSFEQGKIYGIVGKNGAGKTTFFKTLTNIITNYTGDVLIDGQNIKDDTAVLSKIGIVLDDMELYKNRTGLFNLRYFGGLRGIFDEERAFQIARELSIFDNLQEKVSSYSLGMNKKLILLISLMNDAQILIFDEPFRGLDTATVDWFKNYLLQLKKEGRMILISSHVQEDIETLSDKVYVLENGNFDKKFDLNDRMQVLIYRVEVDLLEEFKQLLTEQEVAFEQQDKLIVFEMKEEAYKELFKKAVEKDIEFYQIKKESKFAQFVR